MSACEVCWEAAQRDVMLLGGSVVDHYQRRLSEVDNDPQTLWTGTKHLPRAERSEVVTE